MMRIYIILFLLHIWINSIKTSEFRTKRFLTFPRTSPTRLQLIMGIGIPVELEIESVTIGWVNKFEFFLPENATNFLSWFNDPFELTTRPISGFYDKRSVEIKANLFEESKPIEVSETSDAIGYDSEQNEKYEKHQAQAVIVEHSFKNDINSNFNEISEAEYWNQEDQAKWFEKFSSKKSKNLSKSRWEIYKTIALFAESQGFSGRMCVLRSICESAHTEFDYSNGILGELMHILMTPSLTTDELTNHKDNEYYHAEKLGKDGAPCEQIFSECKSSVLEQFSGIYSPILDIIDQIIK